MNRVIITGGNGFIGRHLLRRLSRCGRTSIIVISDNPIKSHIDEDTSRENNPLTYHNADVRDAKIISDIFMRERADTCIHLAAKTSVLDSIEHPDETMEINVKGTLNVLEACHNSHVKNFVFASSAAVYGDVRQLPITENCSLRPLSPYGTSKMLAEQHVSSYKKSNKIQNTISLRIFNVYGPGQTNESDVVTKFAKRLSNGMSPVIHGNGSHTRDFISIEDVIDAIILSIRTMEQDGDKHNSKIGSPAVFNVGTGIPTSINQVAKKMIEIFGYDLDPIYDKLKVDGNVILHSYADITKSREILGFVPKKAIDVGLKEMVAPMLLRK